MVKQEFSIVRFSGDKAKADAVYRSVSLYLSRHDQSNANLPSDYEPLTPEDVAEIIVFATTRRENVVMADTLIFPNQQVCPAKLSIPVRGDPALTAL